MHRKEENHFRTIYDAAAARLSAVRRIAGDAFDTIAALQRWPAAWRFAFAILRKSAVNRTGHRVVKV